MTLRDQLQAAATAREAEIERVRSVVSDMVKLMNARFDLDPAKVAAFQPGEVERQRRLVILRRRRGRG